jgi:hypothetical protein
MSDRPITDNPAVNGCSELMLAVVLVIVACVCFCSCKPAKEVQVERVEVPVVVTQEHTIESVKVDHIRDTLIQRDSIYHYIKGDTTIIERWHHTQGQTIVTRVDTLHVFDSVPYPVEVTKEKVVTKIEEVNVLRWWQKLLIGAGGLALIALGLFGAYKLGKR